MLRPVLGEFLGGFCATPATSVDPGASSCGVGAMLWSIPGIMVRVGLIVLGRHLVVAWAWFSLFGCNLNLGCVYIYVLLNR